MCNDERTPNQAGTIVTLTDRLTSCALPEKSQRAGCVFHTLPVSRIYLTDVYWVAARKNSLEEAQWCCLYMQVDVKSGLTLTTT